MCSYISENNFEPYNQIIVPTGYNPYLYFFRYVFLYGRKASMYIFLVELFNTHGVYENQTSKGHMTQTSISVFTWI